MGNSYFDLFTCVYSLSSTHIYPQTKTVMTTTNKLIVTEEKEWLVLGVLSAGMRNDPSPRGAGRSKSYGRSHGAPTEC
jgi:hypothetical protein